MISRFVSLFKLDDNWDPSVTVFDRLGTHQDWAQVEQHLRDTAALLHAQRSAGAHILHILQAAWSVPTARHEDAAPLRSDVELGRAHFAEFDGMLEYMRQHLARITHVPPAHYRDWKLPTVLALLARLLSGGVEPSRRMRFVEWWYERLELLVQAGLVPTLNEATRVHRAQSQALAKTVEGWADHVMRARAGGRSEWERVPPFFWHCLRAEFSQARKCSVSYWAAVRFSFYAGDYAGVRAAAQVLHLSKAIRTFEKVHTLITSTQTACEAILARSTHVPDPPDGAGFARLVWLRACAMAKWARRDFSSLDEFVRWQAEHQ